MLGMALDQLSFVCSGAAEPLMRAGAALRRKASWDLAAAGPGATTHRKGLQYALQAGPLEGLASLQGSVHFAEHLLWWFAWPESPVHAKIESRHAVQVISIVQAFFAHGAYSICATFAQSSGHPGEIRLMCISKARGIATSRFNCDHLLLLWRRTLRKTFFGNRALALLTLSSNAWSSSSLQAMQLRPWRSTARQSPSGLGTDLLWLHRAWAWWMP